MESAELSEEVLSLLQGGFRRGRGCREQSLLFLACILAAKRKRRNAFCAFIDFSKAYDTVQHDKLWSVLSAIINIGPLVLGILRELYKNYFMHCEVGGG